jgi:hypothetical protein
MKTNVRARWLLAGTAVGAIALAAWLGRAQVEGWTRSHLAAEHQRQLLRLSEDEAAALVTRLAAADNDEYLDLVVLAFLDKRSAVADAAQRGLAGRGDCWSRWPADKASPRVAALATLLARSADQVPLSRRAFVQRLAERLLSWPVDGRRVDAEQLIVDCEKLLRLPAPTPEEGRIARAEPSRETAVELMAGPEILPPPPATVPPASLEPFSPGAFQSDFEFPRRPAPLPDASRERPVPPRQFIAPRAKGIMDE